MQSLYTLYTENYKTLMSDKEGHSKKWDIPHTWVGRLNIFKRLIFSELIYRFKAIPIKISAGIF